MTESVNQRDTMLANFSLSGGPDVAAAFGGLLGERDRLRAERDSLADELEHERAVKRRVVDAALVEATRHRDLLRSALRDILIVEYIDSAKVIAQGALDAVPSELDEVERND